MTAYVLMSIMHGNQKSADYSASIIQWLNKQRNPYGGFSSTQVRVQLGSVFTCDKHFKHVSE